MLLMRDRIIVAGYRALSPLLFPSFDVFAKESQRRCGYVADPVKGESSISFLSDKHHLVGERRKKKTQTSIPRLAFNIRSNMLDSFKYLEPSSV